VTKLKNGTQSSTGIKFWAITIVNGDTTHVILMTEEKPPFTVRLISSSDLAPLMTAMDAKNTIVCIGATKMLLANICATLAEALVFPANIFCKVPTR